ncbi:hypothetical protein TorRG33x02_166550 [Trema orientale]|uniref:Uncharacterized protein n=1 Tax=Trema orientale TaxID=63057 RepID=A0A2P5EPK3_TREOI|nr:hypothetical protein TorRG33x02_166550 [Trema orientale]
MTSFLGELSDSRVYHYGAKGLFLDLNLYPDREFEGSGVEPIFVESEHLVLLFVCTLSLGLDGVSSDDKFRINI